MELAEQIRTRRKALSLSQEELAEKIFVSRQSVSNWENGKTYPDIKSLILLGDVFSVSLDQLIKGDKEIMRKEIDAQEKARYNLDANIFAGLFLLTLLTPVPLIMLFGWWGAVPWGILFGVSMFFALRVEKYKKKMDIQTFKEILAFEEGTPLSEIEKAREEGKRPYQKVLGAVLCGILGILVGAAMIWIVG